MSIEFGKTTTSVKRDGENALKNCLQAVAGLPIEAAIASFGSGLAPDEANFLRSLTEEDLAHLRHVEERLHAALGESGDGCGIYN